MELVIPDGVSVFIAVGHTPPAAWPHEQPTAAVPAARPGGRVAKTLLAGVVLIGVFEAGRLLPHHPDSASAAQTAAAAPPAGATGTSAAGEIPPAFRAQLAQPAQVVPPPGAASTPDPGNSGNSGSNPAAKTAPPNPFGLQG